MYIPPNYNKKNFFSDVFIGIIIALVSIPISMGYSLVAGLPAVYGLYGSLLPIALFGLLSSSPRFVFGVDAAPAALACGIIVSFEIQKESVQAIQILPLITLLVSLWLFVFYIFRADRLLKFISQSVMGGFITGIGTTIICMQVPKLFGGSAGTGEFIELVVHIAKEANTVFNVPSLVLGLSTIIIILLCKHFIPKLPSQPLLMFMGAALTYFFNIDKYGIQTLPSVQRGLPPFAFPNIALQAGFLKELVLPCASIAVVILAETLLASSNLALKNKETLNTRREILSYAVGNLAASLSGCCPVNGSVSRSSIANQFGVKSQVMSLVAALTMGLILLFGTGFIQYLPIPVLTGIVISALIGTLEFSLAHKLRKLDKAEFIIFYAAFFAVLLLGTIYGVIVGVLLSAVTFILRQSRPVTDFLGVVQGQKGYYSLTRTGTAAVPIKNTIIYRFSAPLFYANITQFCNDVEKALQSDTKIFVIDASGINSIDATACERLVMLYKSFKEKGIKLYIAGHVSALNDQMRAFGAELLIQEHVVRPRIAYALDAAGLPHPYPADESKKVKDAPFSAQMEEFEWAYGSEAPHILENMAQKAMEQISTQGLSFTEDALHNLVKEQTKDFWNEAVEDEFLDLLDMKIHELRVQSVAKDFKANVNIENIINHRHLLLEEAMLDKNEDIIKKVIQHRLRRDELLKKHHYKAWQLLQLEHERYFEIIAMENPQLAKRLAEIISDNELDKGASKNFSF